MIIFRDFRIFQKIALVPQVDTFRYFSVKAKPALQAKIFLRNAYFIAENAQKVKIFGEILKILVPPLNMSLNFI